MSCYPTHFWEVKHANLGGVFDGNIGTDPQCLCHVLHPGGHRFRQSLPGTDWYFVTKIVLTYCEKQDRRYSDPKALNG